MRLNLIDDAGAENLRSVYSERVRPDLPPFRRYKAHLHLGLLAWRDGDLDAARQHLATAAELAATVFSQKSPGGRTRRPKDFDLPLMLTLAFGNDDLKERVAHLQRSCWLQEDDAEYRPLADLLDILRKFPENKKLNADAIRKVLESNDRPEAQVWYKPWIKAMGEGLVAITQKKKASVEKAIHTLLQRHEKEAEEGDWRYLVEGLMATWALVLYRFARESGIEVENDSPYFPKDYSS